MEAQDYLDEVEEIPTANTDAESDWGFGTFEIPELDFNWGL